MSTAADRIRAYLNSSAGSFAEPRIIGVSAGASMTTADLREVIDKLAIQDGMLTSAADALSRAQEGDYHDENTMPKVRKAIMRTTTSHYTDEIISDLLNAGILFRERRPEPQLMVGEERSPRVENRHPFALTHESMVNLMKAEEPPMRYWAYVNGIGARDAYFKAERLTFEAGHVVGWIGDLPVFAEKNANVSELRLISDEDARKRGLA